MMRHAFDSKHILFRRPASGKAVEGSDVGRRFLGGEMRGRGIADITGQKFGRLTVLRMDESITHGKRRWICKCDCGTIKSIMGTHLNQGRILSCGCLKAENSKNQPVVELAGKKFGRLTVLRRVESRPGECGARWKCVCDCGNETELRGNAIHKGRTLSCGCLRLEECKKAVTTHGETINGEWTREYHAWMAMTQRCRPNHPRFHKYYAGRGIVVFEEWKSSPKSFCDYVRANLGPCPEGWTLDRIDNNGNYEPGNIRWASIAMQSANRRPYSEWDAKRKQRKSAKVST